MASISFKEFIKSCFKHFGFTILFKKWAKEKKGDIFLREKKTRKTKQCCHNDICRWKRNSFSIEVEIKFN